MSGNIPRNPSNSPQAKAETLDPLSTFAIIRDSLKYFLKSALPCLLLIIILSAISALFATLILSNWTWQMQVLGSEFKALEEASKDPAFVPTEEQRDVQMAMFQLTISLLVGQSVLQFLVPISLLILVAGKIHHLITGEKDLPSTWAASAIYPFSSVKKAFTTISLLLAFIFLIPIGIMLFYIPGILIMIFGLFSIHALIVDEKLGRETIKGGVFYARDNFIRLLMMLFVAFFIPWYAGYRFSSYIMPLMGFTGDSFLAWINPATQNWGMIFLYFWMGYITQSFLYIWFPAVWGIAFVRIRKQKLDVLKNISPGRKASADSDQAGSTTNVRIMDVAPGQKNYFCSKCGQKLPVSAKKCVQCGQLYRLILRR